MNVTAACKQFSKIKRQCSRQKNFGLKFRVRCYLYPETPLRHPRATPNTDSCLDKRSSNGWAGFNWLIKTSLLSFQLRKSIYPLSLGHSLPLHTKVKPHHSNYRLHFTSIYPFIGIGSPVYVFNVVLSSGVGNRLTMIKLNLVSNSMRVGFVESTLTIIGLGHMLGSVTWNNPYASLSECSSPLWVSVMFWSDFEAVAEFDAGTPGDRLLPASGLREVFCVWRFQFCGRLTVGRACFFVRNTRSRWPAVLTLILNRYRWNIGDGVGA